MHRTVFDLSLSLCINLEILTLISIGAADILVSEMSAAPMLTSVRISRFMYSKQTTVIEYDLKNKTNAANNNSTAKK